MVINLSCKGWVIMKNFTGNQNNAQAENGDKLISYQFAGGVSNVFVVLSSMLTLLFCICSVVFLIGFSESGNKDLIPAMIFFNSLSFLGLAGTVISAVVRIKVCNRYSNRGFELYHDKIVFTRDSVTQHIEQRNIAKYVVLSLLIPGFYYYWLWLQVKNTKVLGNNYSNYYGELPLLAFVPFYSYFWFITRGEFVNRELKKRGYTSASHGVTLLILSIFGLGIVSLAILQRDFNNIPADAPIKEQQETHEDSYMLTDVNKIYIDNKRSFCVETGDSKITMPLTSRDFRIKLNSILKNNAA